MMMNRMMKIMKKRKAFTLVEVMIALAIIGLLLTLGVPGFLRSRNKAWRDTCVNNLRMIEHAADQYRIDNNLVTTKDVKIIWLWPTNSTGKDVSSYINRQLVCPKSGTTYTGGVEVTGAIQTDIDANGLPHCATGANVTNSSPTSTAASTSGATSFEHSIESAGN